MSVLNLENLLAYYKKVKNGYYKATPKKVEYKSTESSTVASYVSYVKSYDKLNDGNTCGDILNLLKFDETTNGGNNGADKADWVEYARGRFEEVVRDKGLQAKTIGNYRTAYMDLCRVVVGRYDADVWFDNPQTDSIYHLVAENALFASPDVVDQLTKGIFVFDGKIRPADKYACWDRQYIRDNSKHKGETTIDVRGKECKADDNTQANHAIKYAVRESCPDVKIKSIRSFRNYEACHIVPKVDNMLYFTSIPNLVLLHRALASLTDHIKDIQDLLNYHAWNLYHKSIPNWEAPHLSSKLEGVYKELKWRVNW